MKYIMNIFFVVLTFTSCAREDKDFEDKQHSISMSASLSEEYIWESFESGNIYGEVLFIPVYSSVYHQNDKTFDLTATLSIHNTDINSKIRVIKVNYYDSNGMLVRSFINDEVKLNALQSRQFIIKETDVSGGTAAKFIIQWQSELKVVKPIVEAVMISTSSQQGISFKTESKTISSVGY